MTRHFFSSEGNWYKGNLHAHTTRSDGLVPPERQAADYRERGYHFLAITDHNRLEDFSRLNQPGFLMIPGWERDIPYGPTKCLHLVGVCKAWDAPPCQLPPGSPLLDSQPAFAKSMKAMGQLVFIAHPVWSRMTRDELLALGGVVDGIEVYNTGCQRLGNAGRGDLCWETLLQAGFPLLGFAVDDTHGKHPKDDRFEGWIQVRADELTPGAILDAVAGGQFYASAGPEIFDAWQEDDTIHVTCSPCREIHFITYPARGGSFYGESALLTDASYPLKGMERGGQRYVRIECIDALGRTAWTNPLYL